jgi:hypothetical protein
MNKALNERLEAATARVEGLLHIGSMMTDFDALPDALSEMLGDQDDKELKRLFPGIPDSLLEDFNSSYMGDCCEWLYDKGKLGFLVQFATPVMHHYEDGRHSGRGYSWGHYSTKWFYSETFEEAIELGLAWVAERRQLEAGGKVATLS